MENLLKTSTKTWELKKLSDICLVNPRYAVSDERDLDIEVPFIPMKAVGEENGSVVCTETKNFKSHKKGFTYFESGDVLFAKITPCMENGKIAIVPEWPGKIGLGSTEFHVLRPSKVLLNKYLFYFLIQSKFRREAKFNMTGAVGQKRIPKSFLEDYLIPLTTFSEQQEIVCKVEALFSEIDAAVSSLGTAKEQLQSYRQSVLKHAFEGYFTGGNEDWESTTIGALPLQVFDGPFGSNLKSSDYVENGIRVIRLENIGELIFKDEYRTYITKAKYDNLKKHTVGSGDIIFSSFISESIRVTQLPPAMETAINKADCFCIRVLDESTILSRFILYFLASKEMYNQLVGEIHGATRPRINTTQLKACKIPLPNVVVQKKVVEAIENLFTESDILGRTVEEQMLATESLRQSILHQAFNGRYF